ncbi:MAG: Lrp/AsnC family transcriptional regulator [Candidatus Bathyarchaeia archaeon]
MALDDLDRKIIQYLSSGTNSYQELARTCNVTRNTIYRRIAALEKEGTIKNTLHCIVNLEQMEITPVTIGVRIRQISQDTAINLLTANKYVKFLWRTYGDHNFTVVAFCPKGKEGEIIQDIRTVLEGLNAEHICISVGFVWEKMCYSPFEEQSEIEEKITQIIENRALITKPKNDLDF